MTDAVLRVAIAVDKGFGAHGKWDRLVVDQATQAHREDLKKIARLALQAVADLEWPEISAGCHGPDGTITVMIPAETARNMVRRVLWAI
jgi:hypothetical protein